MKKKINIWVRVGVMAFNTTFNNISVISWRSVLLVEETRVPRENHLPVASHWQTLSHNVVSSTSVGFELTTLVVICTDCTGSCKSNYHTILTMMVPKSTFVFFIGLNITRTWQFLQHFKRTNFDMSSKSWLLNYI